MLLNFVMMVTGHLAESYYGRAKSCQEFRDRYENGEFEKEDNSEVEMEELWVRDFDCPLCKQRHPWVQVGGPGSKECLLECKTCKASFAIGMLDCANCIDRETKCLAVIP